MRGFQQRESLIPCANSYKDCGLCKPGFIEDEEDVRICYAIEILEEPREALKQVPESDVYLTCKFNTRVYCVWERNGQHVAIGGGSRYQFTDNNANNLKVNDCSINIRSLSANDVGGWQCSNAADSFTNSMKSKAFHIYIVSGNPWIEFNGKNVTGAEISIPNSDSSLRSKRGTSDHGNEIINCLAHIPAELTLKIGDVTVKHDNNSMNTTLYLNQIKRINLTDAKLDCIAKYSGAQKTEKISSVTLRLNSQSTITQSSISSDELDPQSIESKTKPTFTKTIPYRPYVNNCIPKWVIPRILIPVIVLMVLCLLALVSIAIIYVKISCSTVLDNQSKNEYGK